MTSWLIPCSPTIYDAESAFSEYGTLIWHQQCRMSVGDVAYIYVTSPVQQIRCKCEITAVDIPEDVSDDDGYVLDEDFCAKRYTRYMQLQLIERYQPCYLLSYQHMLNNGLGGAIRSHRRVLPWLEEYLKSVTSIGSIRYSP